jgi:hypothetical protein
MSEASSHDGQVVAVTDVDIRSAESCVIFDRGATAHGSNEAVGTAIRQHSEFGTLGPRHTVAL